MCWGHFGLKPPGGPAHQIDQSNVPSLIDAREKTKRRETTHKEDKEKETRREITHAYRHTQHPIQ